MDALVAAVAAFSVSPPAPAVDAAAPPAPPAPPALPAHVQPYDRVTVEKRWAIIAYHKDGKSTRKISRQLVIHRNTVAHWIDTYARTGGVSDGKRSGRPRCTDDDTNTTVVLVALEEKFTTPRQIIRTLGLDASVSTIDRRLKEAGLYGRVAMHKRDYSEVELRKRMSFARGYGDKSEQWWERVLFSDEKCFYGMGFCGQTWVRRPAGTALDPAHCVHKTAHPVKVNAWACFSATGQGYMHIFNENMDAALMKSILEANLLPSAELAFGHDDHAQWYLLHDNDKKFTSILVRDYLHNNGVTCLEFPPYSPDLNPIENLWGAIARACEQHQCATMEELQEVVSEEWNKVDHELMRTLAHSMPARCQAVINANGWHTKY